MSIDPADAIEELVANRFAGDRRAGGKNFCHCAGVLICGLLRGQPIRIATAGPGAGDVVHVLDRCAQSSKWPARRADDRRIEIMWNEKRICHAPCFLYQSRIRAPSQAATPGLLNTSSKARRTCAIRCGTPER